MRMSLFEIWSVQSLDTNAITFRGAASRQLPGAIGVRAFIDCWQTTVEFRQALHSSLGCLWLLLVLYVGLENIRAIQFYDAIGFAELHKPYKDKATGREYKRMVLVLKDPPT